MTSRHPPQTASPSTRDASLLGLLTSELWEYTPAMLPEQRAPAIPDPLPDPEPASPSLPEPDPGVYHRESAPRAPAKQCDAESSNA